MVPPILRPNPLSLALILAALAPAGIHHNFQRPVFVYSLHPDVPVTRFIAGDIGIPEPQYARIYLFATYRYLEGNPLTTSEQQRWLNVWKVRTSKSWPEWKADQVWLRARKRIPVPLPNQQLRPSQISGRDYTYSSPCSDDAFATAARTLEARARRFGPNSAEVKFWVQGQDAVFEACATAAPQTLSPAQHPLLRADREYQIAAATLYAQHFDEAAALFQKIAQDPQSPWRTWAPYQKGRALLYKARQTQSDTVYNTALLAAQNQFQSVLANPALRESHPAAEYLYLRCLLITNHRAALERIARRLLRGDWTESDLTLYLNGMDDVTQPPRDPLSQWILTFQKGTSAANPASPAWLYAALWHKRPAPIEPALASPHAALRYVAARHLTRQGKVDEARPVIAKVIADLNNLPSAQNRARQLHAQLSETWEQFLERAPRKPLITSNEMDADEWESRAVVDPKILALYDRDNVRQYRQQYLNGVKHAATLQSQTHWDESAAAILTERIPLELLQTIQPRLALTIFTRAVLLNRWPIAQSAASHLKSQAVTPFLQNPNEFTAAVLLLDFPGASPVIRYGYGRDLPPTEHDEYGRNWWDEVSARATYNHDLPYLSEKPQPNFTVDGPVPFLTPHQIREATQEYQILQTTGKFGLRWIAEKVVAGPHTPELLYRILKSTEGGWFGHPVQNGEQAPFKKAAQLLSTRYRNSRWHSEAQKLMHWGQF